MKNIFTIPPGISFLDELAKGLWERAEKDPAQLAAMHVLLPTRRACRRMREAFLNHIGDRAVLLPHMRPIGDIDEDEWLFSGGDIGSDIPPAIAPLRRRLLLAQLIKARDETIGIDQATHLAEALARFLDEAQIRQCDFGRLENLVQERELAVHWQETVRFLGILTEAWPRILAEEGCVDPADRRNRVLAAQAEAWRRNPPAYPVIAAGSTGTIPATATLLDVIAGLPLGSVILPGLDLGMNEEAWQAVNELHPQSGMKELLQVMKAERRDVQQWGKQKEEILRARLLGESMRPAAVADAWRHLKPETIPLESVQGLERAVFAHPQEEAQAIALMLRGALEDPQATAALVTPDRNLAERVAVLMARWGINIDDSAATSLAEQPVGGFLCHLLDAAEPQAGAVAWLSLLKHPYAACGLAPAECRARARQLELAVWRTEKPESSPWLDELRNMLKPLTGAWHKERPPGAWLDDHLRIAKWLAASDEEKGADRLWKGDAGDAAAEWLDDLRASAMNFPPVNGDTYRNLFTSLLRQAGYRPAHGKHPRLGILGPLEARLLHFDFIVLGGMNEGIWPPEPAIDPWMSRPMKRDFGMGSPEHRIGLSAHDFVQLACLPRVMLTRSQRSGGSPTVPSRFLLQLETVLRALGHSNENLDALAPQQPWQVWAHKMDEPPQDVIKPCAAPEPCPPVGLRPTALSVTEIGTWQRNPYAIYAKHVLGLRKLDPLEAEIDAADRGNLIHKALEKFIRESGDPLPHDAHERLLSIGRTLFEEYKDDPEVKAFWWPRFERIAAWFIEKERERRAEGIRPLAVETAGQAAFGSFTLKGRADRIDRMPDGKVSIIDYKTGGVPSKKEVEAGLEPQLPLLALIAERGGFADAKTATGEFAYWKLGGGRSEESHKETAFREKLDGLMQEAETGLENLVRCFADPATSYQAVPKPGRAPRHDDYAHLARLAEWGRTSQD